MEFNLTTTTINNETINTVNARELHERLELKRKFTDWVVQYVSDENEFGFEQSIDFIEVHADVNINNVPIINYAFTIDMAKEVSMLTKTEIGKKVRKYFIEVEKKNKPKELTIFDYARMLLKTEDMLSEANRTKAHISDKKTATALGKLGGTTKALNIAKRKLQDLATDTLKLDDARTGINMMVRAYAEIHHNRDYQSAWGEYYRIVKPRLHTTKSLKDWNEEQLRDAYQYALSLCELKNVDISNLYLEQIN